MFADLPVPILLEAALLALLAAWWWLGSRDRGGDDT
jgi:hypothetical protein